MPKRVARWVRTSRAYGHRHDFNELRVRSQGRRYSWSDTLVRLKRLINWSLFSCPECGRGKLDIFHVLQLQEGNYKLYILMFHPLAKTKNSQVLAVVRPAYEVAEAELPARLAEELAALEADDLDDVTYSNDTQVRARVVQRRWSSSSESPRLTGFRC